MIALTLGHTGTRVCGFGYGINSNTAEDGAAIYSSVNEFGATLRRSDLDSTDCGPEPATTTWGAIDSPSLSNTFFFNVATAPSGGVINIQDEGVFQAEQVSLQRNQGDSLIYVLFAKGTNLDLINCLIVNNTAHRDLIEVVSDLGYTAELRIDSCTVALNTLDPHSWVLAPHSATTTLQRSILWQPVNESVYIGSQKDTVTDVIAGEIATLSRGTSSGLRLVDDPGFISTVAFTEDYHLQPTSPAVDYSSIGSPATDSGWKSSRRCSPASTGWSRVRPGRVRVAESAAPTSAVPGQRRHFLQRF